MSEFQFEKHVFPAELASIRARIAARASRAAQEIAEHRARVEAGKPAPPLSTDARSPMRATDVATTRPTTAHGLVGLALSGGGIRSAMFNLGILQGLYRAGVLRHVDYLSTVSGGGYIGGAWSALSHAAGSPFPFSHTVESREPPAIIHLRKNANYLMLGGSVDGVRMAMVVLRGILLNLLVILPWTVLMATATSWIYWPQLVDNNGDRLPFSALTPFEYTRWLAPAYAIALLLSPIMTNLLAWQEARRSDLSGNYWARDLFERSVAWGAIVVSLSAFTELQPIVVALFHDYKFAGDRIAWTGASGTLSILTALAARQSASGGGFLSRVLWIAAAMLGPVIPLLMFVSLADWLIFEGIDPDGYTYELGFTAFAFAVMGYNYAFVNVNQHSGHRFWRDRLSLAFLRSPTPDGTLEHVDALKLSQLAQPGSDAPYHIINTTLNLQGEREMVNRARNGDFFIFSKHFIGGDRVGYAPTPVVESVSPHINLGTAMAISSAAAAPNAGTATVSSMTALLTLLNVRMGFWIPQPRRIVEHLKIRADQPVETPMRRYPALSWRAGGHYLWREMQGALTSRTPLVNVSDGGHLENLGVYELLRRRCRYIICGDGEADEAMQFTSLAALIRYARIDFGIEIDIALDDVALKPDGSYGRQHAAIGTIRYPAVDGAPAETGVFLYFKASLTGDEDSMIAQYKAASPAFPHESTADQFFSEAQIEAYRALGYHIARNTFSNALGPSDALPQGEPHALAYSEVEQDFEDGRETPRLGLTGAFRRLRVTLAVEPKTSTTEFGDLQVQLQDVMRHASPHDLFNYYTEMYPNLDNGLSAAPYGSLESDGVYRRRILELVGGQIGLMESVYRRLHLHEVRTRNNQANAGWIHLFQRWASAPSFRWAATLHTSAMSQGLRVFCADVLGLRWSIAWRRAEDTLPVWAQQHRSMNPGVIQLIGSVVMGGIPVEPREDLVYVEIIDDRGELHLGPHVLRPGFTSPELYQMFLVELSRLVATNNELLPAGRRWVPDTSHLLPPFRGDVDARDIALGIGSEARPRERA